MIRKIFITGLTFFINVVFFVTSAIYMDIALAQLNGTSIYAIQIESQKQGYLVMTFNPDGTITGEAQISSEKSPLPLIGIWGKTIFIVKYKLKDETEVLDHCRFVSDTEFIGFERYKKEGVSTEGITKITGSKRDNI